MINQLIDRIPGWRAQRFVRNQFQNLLSLRAGFDPTLRHNANCSWLLIRTFPNGGSTALAKVLLTASRARALTQNAEGQWLIPEMNEPGSRWDPNHKISPHKIRAVWLSTLHRRGDLNDPCLVVEKSPPNMCRPETLTAVFGDMPFRIIVLTRDPYAVCASWKKRYSLQHITEGWGVRPRKPIDNDLDLFRLLGRIWLDRARVLESARPKADLWLSYEGLTDDPVYHVGEIRKLSPLLDDISPEGKIQVKDYPPQPLKNMNARQTEALSSDEKEAITEGLRADEDLVRRFGYALL